MSAVNLHLEARDPSKGPEPILVEILNTDLESRFEQAQTPGYTRIEIEPGEYLIKAHLPDGRFVKGRVDVPADKVVELNLRPPAIESPDPRQPVSVGKVQVSERYTFDDAKPKIFEPATKPRLPRKDFLSYWPGVWARLWKREGAGWEPVEFQVTESEEGDWSIRYDLDVGSALHLVQVGGPKVAWRFMALPDESSSVEFSVNWSAGEPQLEIRTRTRRADVEALLGYLTTGNLKAATLLVSSMAEEMLRAKMAAPRVAALGAYYLLRAGELERLHDWPRNLRRWMEWLPDGPVIEAWQLIRREDATEEALSQARDLLVMAAERGIPVYTEGLRLLWDGLRLFREDRPADAGVAQAMEAIRDYAMTARWEAPTTTFFGETPDKPTRRQILGIPDPPHVSFLD